ncbi:nucleoside 2-deoxyribosyltransferase [archaeon]|jgi:nucleoside 2-deoxyribosyltransferase|nr:nucleoside 2-deoxyribosyltransferase [archaeon]MBT4373116.1 nucleoside 2-deoxyribosyltransferase [archaeon]MBT4531461.1 nucleoside 2-deoxyribosyltransferase [archaeon]MBT7001361.1 nucleoside 2-deoxyribosyltransferase [archaeon]MBT7282153.1 nucleoside 2-deoxyribosyltransferase [archaeon]
MKAKKIYVAGPLCTEEERKFMEKIDSLCIELGFETFLPHRDAGLWKEGKKFEDIAKEDLKGFEDCDLIVANLNGFGIGAGTAWEMGYAHAKGIPVIGLKTDRAVKESIEEISAIILGVTQIVESFEALKKEISSFK